MQNGKRILGAVTLLLGLAMMVGVRASEDGDVEMMRRAVDKAVAQISEQLNGTEFSIKSIAVVPMRDDLEGEYVTDQLRSIVTKSPYDAFTRDDATWNTLLDEIKMGDDKGDVMSPETIQKFGKVEGVEAILYGKVWDKSFSDTGLRAHTRIGVRLAIVETGKEIWATTVEADDRAKPVDIVEDNRREILIAVGALIAVILVLFILNRVRKAVSHASRPL
jgi:hypothetical protein